MKIYLKKMMKNKTIRLIVYKLKHKFVIIFRNDIKRQKLKKIKVGNYKLLANELHSLDLYLEEFPQYSKNLPRISKIINKKYKNYEILDVGANIGDTVALIRSLDIENTIHCVEGVNYYYQLLERNTKDIKNVKIYKNYLSDNCHEKFDIELSSGTAKIKKNSEGLNNNPITLDELSENNNINNIKLIKIDTDGYDLKIIKSGTNTILRNKPIIFFEFDPIFIKENGDDPLSIFKLLKIINYTKLLFYDNYGRFIILIDINNAGGIHNLVNYIQNRKGRFEYYDICAIHRDDQDITDEIEKLENEINKQDEI